MNTEKWIDFIINFAKFLDRQDYKGAIAFAQTIDFEISEENKKWLEESVSIVKSKL